MKDCPICKKAVDGFTCHSCGYTEETAPARQRATGTEPWMLCTHTYLGGSRCTAPGTYSSSTQGGGPWWCFAHYPAFLSWNSAKRSAPPGGFKALHALLHRNRVPSDGSAIE